MSGQRPHRAQRGSGGNAEPSLRSRVAVWGPLAELERGMSRGLVAEFCVAWLDQPGSASDSRLSRNNQHRSVQRDHAARLRSARRVHRV